MMCDQSDEKQIHLQQKSQGRLALQISHLQSWQDALHFIAEISLS